MGMVTQCLTVFGATFILDLVWAEYIRAIGDEKANRGAFFAALVFLLSALATIQYVDNHAMTIPAALGGAAGTYFSIKRKRRSAAHDNNRLP